MNPTVTITEFMPGDILFYAALKGDIADRIITDWTGSQLVHVAIAISAMQKIEALAQAIVLTPIDGRTVATSFSYTKHASPLVAQNLSYALSWLNKQIGSMYGWGDIANAFLAKFEHGVSFDFGPHYDCSGLATEFLIKAGGVKLGALTDPHNVTPIQLANQLGVKI